MMAFIPNIAKCSIKARICNLFCTQSGWLKCLQNIPMDEKTVLKFIQCASFAFEGNKKRILHIRSIQTRRIL